MASSICLHFGFVVIIKAFMKIALVSFNPHVGHVSKNLNRMIKFIEEALVQEAQLIVFPEMALIGYPPKDLLFFNELYKQQNKALVKLKALSKKIAIIAGGFDKNTKAGAPFQNVGFFFQNGQKQSYAKQLLPNYDVFDEKRYFHPGESPFFFKMGRWQFGLTICEDIWSVDPKLKKRYALSKNLLKDYQKRKIDYLINISASPFELGKHERRQKLFQKVCHEASAPLIYVNQCGANDDLIFDGRSYVCLENGAHFFESEPFEENIHIIDLKNKSKPLKTKINDLESIRKALVLGIKDYFHKSGFQTAVLGLSGGIDSAIVTQLAAEALGPENVLAVMMPSRFSSDGSLKDSKKLIKNLKIESLEISIDVLHKSYEKVFKKVFGKNATKDLTSQNIQARIRGNLLMAISNNSGRLLLNTTNKSEMAMGYGTLYGDMCGALAVISDLTKEQVYDVAKHMNPNFEIIPKAIFTKSPSAELKPNQKDSDNLPDYSVLDPIIIDFVENFTSDSKHTQIQNTVFASEYKRFQAPLGLKINEKAFGSGRRIPIVQKLST